MARMQLTEVKSTTCHDKTTKGFLLLTQSSGLTAESAFCDGYHDSAVSKAVSHAETWV